MKRISFKIVLVFLFCSVVYNALAQRSAETTIILLRHAEKDSTGTDPQLTVAGKARAERLVKIFKRVKPDAMFSTPYIRTRETLAPWAKHAGLETKTYDPANLKGIAQQLKSMEGKTVVVAGHSNTTPALANLIIGSEKYKALDDKMYSKIWVITIESNGTISDKIIEY